MNKEAGDQTSLSFRASGETAPQSSLGLRLEVDSEDIGWVLFDSPGPINKLTGAVVRSLRELVDQAARKNVRGLVFASDKPRMFIAGADVDEFGGVTDPQIGKELAAYGQAVFETISRFPHPTVAVVNGPCVGGGYELALACTWIVAEDAPSVRIGLPEVKLGILPGFGGTQRLPRRTGLRVALDVILSGKTLPAKPAYKRLMIDALVPEGEGRRIAVEVLNRTRTLTRREPARLDRLLTSWGPLRRFVLNRAKKTLAGKADPQQYPSPHMALEAVAAGYASSETQAYGTEARLLGEAIVTGTSKNLVWLFQSQGVSKKPSAVDLSSARPVKRAAVLGAGVMGGGIGWLAAEKGFPVRIKDIRPEALDSALNTAGSLWHQSVKRRRMTPAERDRKLEKLSFTLDYTGFKHVDFVLEAVVENLNVKHSVIAETENAVGEQAVIASNTSSLRISDIAARARHPERIVGLHFFNPVNRMPLVEVIAGPQSDPRAVATAYRFGLDLGKTPIFVKDAPGFLINRLLAFYLGEALALLQEGADQKTVDRTLKQFGMPMGPYATLDQIGLDVAHEVTKVVNAAYGERLPQATGGIIEHLVSKEKLGKKSGSGFYIYSRGKIQAPGLDVQEAAGNPSPRSFTEEQILDRVLLPMVNEAARCLEENVVSRPVDVDLGMVMGTGFPPFRGGLLRWADTLGQDVVVNKLESLAQTDPRFTPCSALRSLARGFYGSDA